ncbi:hypothetical protein [Nonomuraea sp. NPDC050310]|uniref:hypothetical protein n=1 Tax=unclassified Nonomuraea TaxID=2593643 RepID=UPI0033D558EF
MIEQRLRLGTGFKDAEREKIVGLLQPMEAHLRRFAEEKVVLDLSVKDRDSADQQVTLELEIAGWPKLVATSRDRDLHDGLMDVRHDIIRQLRDSKEKREPQKNRNLREPLSGRPLQEPQAEADEDPDLTDPGLIREA